MNLKAKISSLDALLMVPGISEAREISIRNEIAAIHLRLAARGQEKGNNQILLYKIQLN
jgi:hypothetical protein